VFRDLWKLDTIALKQIPRGIHGILIPFKSGSF
jgi:hypothetical protein